MKWLLNPQDWYGVHKIVVCVFLECPIVLLTVGAGIAWFLVGIMMMKGVEVMTEAAKG